MVNLLIIEDHPITAMVTEELISTVVQQPSVTHLDCFTALTESRPEQVDIIMSDLMLPDSTPEALIDWIAGHYPRSKRIYFSALDTPELIAQIESSGGLYISKSAKYREIVNKVQDYLQLGAVNTQADITRNNFQSLIQMPGSPKPLTIKQAQVMDLLSIGRTAKEIGRVLQLSPDTVRAHLREAFTRLDADSRSTALHHYAQAKKIAERLHGEHAVKAVLSAEQVS